MQTLIRSLLGFAPIIALATARGARPITLVLRTIPRLRKACPFVGVTKRQTLNGILNFSYERAVNRQREREGSKPTFRTQASWFMHTDVPGIVVNAKTGRPHLQLKLQRRLSVEYMDATGNVIAEADLAEYLPQHPTSDKQRLHKPVITIAPAFDSILSFTIDGHTYTV